MQRAAGANTVHAMVQSSATADLLVFAGPTGDHNDRGMAGAPIMGRALGRRLGLTPTVIGTPAPATSAGWRSALPLALPGLRELQSAHLAVLESGRVPVSALSRCAASLATLGTRAAAAVMADPQLFGLSAAIRQPA